MDTKEIYFAAGCFWGTERLYQCIDGVVDTECGFANGNPDISPDYRQVCQGDTGYRETVYVRYDSQKVTLEQLLKAYFHVVDPTVKDRQGNDVGTQYQTGIYYVDEASGAEVQEYARREAEKYPVFATEILPLKKFVPAEEGHQNYLLRNPGGYCHISPLEFSTINQLIR